MHRFLLTFYFAIFIHFLYAQHNNNESALISGAADYARNIYKLKSGDAASIYNGIIHYPYPSSIEGTAYFLSNNWQKGTILFEDILYIDVLMKLDLVADKLVVIANETGNLPIALFSPRVKEFSFPGLKFIYLDKLSGGPSVKEGFYQLLASGKTTALCKSTKTITESISGNTLIKKFNSRKRYYIVKNNQAYLVENKSDLLNILKENKKEIQALLKAKQLNFRNAPQETIIAATQFYNKAEGNLQ